MANERKQPVSALRRRAEKTPTECHSCGVVCEWVVYPAHCLQSECRYAYSYEDGDRRYFGCIERVFTVQLDLAMVENRRRGDAYGALKAQGPPRPECRMELEEAYRFKYSWKTCTNPTFRQHPDEYAPDAVRLLVDGPVKDR